MDIVQRIAVGTLGGTLTLDTEPGVGTTFTMRIPLSIFYRGFIFLRLRRTNVRGARVHGGGDHRPDDGFSSRPTFA